MKRIVLFVTTNLAIVLMLSVTLRAVGVEPYLNAQSLNLASLLIFAAMMGMGAVVITQPRNRREQWLLQTVERQAQAAGIGMPEVAIYDSSDVNAFATGMRRDRALVAVSTGLLQNMTSEKAEAVLGHEVAHIANGDMVTLALIQGVVNTFVLFLSRVIGHTVDRLIFRTESGQGPAFWVTVVIADLVLGILASIIVMWFSRQREFRADRGGAELAGQQSMIAALQRLSLRTPQSLPDPIAAFGISGRQPSNSLQRWFMSHPPLSERIAVLQAAVHSHTASRETLT